MAIARVLLLAHAVSAFDFEWHATQEPPGGSTVGWTTYEGQVGGPPAVTDGAGGAFVAGHSAAGVGTVQLGGSSIAVTGAWAIVLARVSSEVANTNKFVWAMKIGGPADDKILDLAYDGSGGVWLVGHQMSPFMAVGNTCLSSALVTAGQSCPDWSSSSYPDGSCPSGCAGPRGGGNFLARIDSSGTVVHATSVGSNSGTAWSDTMWNAHAACDSSGNLYVAGEIGRASMTFRAGSHTVSMGADSNAVLFKYNAATLDFDWAIPCGIGFGGGPDVRGLVYGSSGLYVAGDVHGTTAFGSHSVTSSVGDPFVARFSESGVAQWAVTASGMGTDNMKDIDADATGAGVWVLTQMGHVAGTSITVGSSSFASMSPHSSIAFHVDSSGTITNAAMIHGSMAGVIPNVYSIVGVSDGYYLGGDKCWSEGTHTLGSQTLTSMGAYVAHYSTSTNDFDGLKDIPGSPWPELGSLVAGTGSDVLVMAKFHDPASNNFLYTATCTRVR